MKYFFIFILLSAFTGCKKSENPVVTPTVDLAAKVIGNYTVNSVTLGSQTIPQTKATLVLTRNGTALDGIMYNLTYVNTISYGEEITTTLKANGNTIDFYDRNDKKYAVWSDNTLTVTSATGGVGTQLPEAALTARKQ